MLTVLIAFVQAHLADIYSLVLTAGFFYSRKWVHTHMAVQEATIVELQAQLIKLAPDLADLSNPEKKDRALAALSKSLPLIFKPLLPGTLSKTIDAVVPAAKERAGSIPPSLQPEPPADA